MDDYPLPWLTPDDPENRLSVDARRRIQIAHLEASATRAAKEADFVVAEQLRAKRRSEIANDDYRARLEHARSILRVKISEFVRSGIFSLSELKQVVLREVDGACASLGVDTHEVALRFEMNNFVLAERAALTTTSPSNMATADGARKQRVKAFLDAHPGAKKADIYRSASVDRSDFQKWEKDDLSESSVMAERIEKVLSGQLTLNIKRND